MDVVVRKQAPAREFSRLLRRSPQYRSERDVSVRLHIDLRDAVDVMVEAVELRTRLQQSQPRAVPRLLVPAAAVVSWEPADGVLVEVTINGVDLGKRPLKAAGEEGWSLLIPLSLCERALVRVDETVLLRLKLGTSATPTELRHLLATSVEARQTWDGLAEAQRRRVIGDVSAGRTAATRWSRAARSLGGPPRGPHEFRPEPRSRKMPKVTVEIVVRPECREAQEDALRALARGAVEMFLYQEWRAFVVGEGRDPDLERPPPEVAAEWYNDIERRLGKDYLEKLRLR